MSVAEETVFGKRLLTDGKGADDEGGWEEYGDRGAVGG